MPERDLRPRYGRVEIPPETRGRHRGGVRQAPLASHAHWEAYCEPCDWVGEQWGPVGSGPERPGSAM
jgi:hypothetical protein